MRACAARVDCHDGKSNGASERDGRTAGTTEIKERLWRRTTTGRARETENGPEGGFEESRASAPGVYSGRAGGCAYDEWGGGVGGGEWRNADGKLSRVIRACNGGEESFVRQVYFLDSVPGHAGYLTFL